MADKYPNFKELSQHEQLGIDFDIRLRQGNSKFAIVAPHGGGIESHTSEIADALAGDKCSFYAFEGLKKSGNGDLHITSTHFDEPQCLKITGRSKIAVTIHGEGGKDSNGIFLGGRNLSLRKKIKQKLAADGFAVKTHSDPKLQGLEKKNICNRGMLGKGIQFEFSRTVRKSFFKKLMPKGKFHPTNKFRKFVKSVAGVLK